MNKRFYYKKNKEAIYGFATTIDFRIIFKIGMIRFALMYPNKILSTGNGHLYKFHFSFG